MWQKTILKRAGRFRNHSIDRNPIQYEKGKSSFRTRIISKWSRAFKHPTVLLLGERHFIIQKYTSCEDTGLKEEKISRV